jgi:hypothetical protein
MNADAASSRRRFIRTAGAALAVPLAASEAFAAGRADDGEMLAARLAELEDREAIRRLSSAFARHLNARAFDELAKLFVDSPKVSIDAEIRCVSADPAGDDDRIEIAANRLTATARLHRVVETDMTIGPSCTLVDMARAQGEGYVRSCERRVIEQAYAKIDGRWKISESTFVSTSGVVASRPA